MRILFVSDTYYPHLNGVYYFVCRVAPLLRDRGHQVAVIAPSESVHPSLKTIDGLDVHGIPSLPILFYPKVRFPVPVFLKSRVARLIDEFKPDVIHIQDHFAISAAVVSVCKGSGIPIVGTNHFMAENLTAFIDSEKWKQRIANFLWSEFSAVFDQLDVITTPTETAARLIRPKLKVNVLPVSSGIDLENFSPYGGAANMREKYRIPEKPVLLFVGRLDPEKNIEEILHAVALALRKIDFCFVIVGRGARRVMLDRKVKELGLEDGVIFTGFVPDEDLPGIYRTSRCFIISSQAELLSLSALQAMASGVPVIAVRAGALPEIVHHGYNGFLYEAGDTEAMAECIRRIVTDETLDSIMRKNSLAYVYDHDIHLTVKSFERIYQSLTKSNPGEWKISRRPEEVQELKYQVHF